jgi:two-component system response regulator YesN
MYKLIIADDEEIIRSGLKDIVNWQRLGFEIAGTFADGREVIAFLEDNPVDVVLSDIKMTFVSGMEVARYILERELPTKVMLISGFQELNLAMSAIKFKVQDYILKPIDLDELTAALRKMRELLDKEGRSLQAQAGANLMEHRLSAVKDHFFDRLLAGSVEKQEDLESLFNVVYPGLRFQQCACFCIELLMEEDIPLHEKHSFLADGGFLKACHSFDGADSTIDYHFTSKDNKLFLVTGLSLDNPSAEDMLKHVNTWGSRLAAYLVRMFPDRLFSLQAPRLFNGIPALLENLACLSDEGVSAEPDVIEQARQYIVEHITEPLSLEELAERFYLSPYYFSRMFKARTGENLIDFMIRYKMEKAMELLKNPRYKVYEVSHMVGYKSERYFSKTFKNYTGFTPHAYRSRLLAGRGPEGSKP